MSKYLVWYRALVDRARHRQTIGYVEKHHIVPTSLGGSDARENIVKLTGREHFLCHLLLSKIFPSESSERNKMVFALHKMVHGSQNEKYALTSWQYEHVRRIHRENMLGVNNPMYGRRHDVETRAKQSNAKKGKPHEPHSDETRAKIAKSHEGKKHTDESRKKMSSSHKGQQLADESRRRISVALTGRPSLRRGRPGTPHTPETKIKMRDARNGKRVAQVERATDSIIQVFETARLAAIVTGVNRGNICTCARGIIFSAGGFCWRYV